MSEQEDRPKGWNIRHYPDGKAGGVAFTCPGCGGESYLPINDAGKSHGWDWNGSEDAPTLTPSIGQRCCSWHGYLTDGRFIKC